MLMASARLKPLLVMLTVIVCVVSFFLGAMASDSGSDFFVGILNAFLVLAGIGLILLAVVTRKLLDSLLGMMLIAGTVLAEVGYVEAGGKETELIGTVMFASGIAVCIAACVLLTLNAWRKAQYRKRL